MFKENLELREKVFEKMGFYYTLNKSRLEKGDIIFTVPYEIPPIETSWEVCAKYLVPFMRGRRIFFKIFSLPSKTFDTFYNHFIWMDLNQDDPLNVEILSEIISDNIALAACEAFMEVKI